MDIQTALAISQIVFFYSASAAFLVLLALIVVLIFALIKITSVLVENLKRAEKTFENIADSLNFTKLFGRIINRFRRT